MDDDCQHALLTHLSPGTRVGPSVRRASYQLVLNGDQHLQQARIDVQSWAFRIHLAATA